MQAHELVIHFETETRLPIDVNDVLTVMRAAGHDDQIEFIGADLDPDILQGAIKIWHQRAIYGDPVRMVNIYYHRGHSKDWQRLITCKESIHIMDPHWVCSTDVEAIGHLADSIGLPPVLQDPFKEDRRTLQDHVAELYAAAILLPWAAREVMMPLYLDGKLTIDDIARQADIPRKFASRVMLPGWERIYDHLTHRSELAQGEDADEESEGSA